MEGGQIHYPEAGTPQGGVISPVLANIYLHGAGPVVVEEVQPRLRGAAFLIRYAGSFIIGCQREDDARRIMEALPKRCARYGLSIQPSKSRLLRFRPPQKGHKTHNQSFDFLGFTHYWGRSQRGKWIMLRKTSGKRLRRTLKGLGNGVGNTGACHCPE